MNVIAPILTKPGGKSVRQTIFYPFQQVSRYGRGTVLEPRIICPEFPTNKYGSVPQLQAAPVHDEQNNSLNVFVLNCGEKPISTNFIIRGYKKTKPMEHEILAGDDLEAINSIENPDRVRLTNADALPEENGDSFQTVLPGYSWNMIRFSAG